MKNSHFSSFGNYRGECDGRQANYEKQKHQGDEFAGVGGCVGKFLPDEHPPDGGNHGGALSDGVGNGGADDLGVGGNKVQDLVCAPTGAAENSPEMPEAGAFGVVAHADGCSASEGLAH